MHIIRQKNEYIYKKYKDINRSLLDKAQRYVGGYI